jgi:hypothetical protein
VTQKRTRSYSQLTDYTHCAWAFRLKRIVRVKERPSVWLPGGKAFHAATEAFDLHTWQENDLTEWADSPEPWLNVFSQEFETGLDELREQEPEESRWRTAGRKTKDKPNGEDVTWWRTAGEDMVRQYIEWRASTNDTLGIAAVKGAAGVEVEVHTTFGDEPVIAYVDRLMEDREDGRLLLLDLKTGSRTPSNFMQLAQYSLQLELEIGRPITWGAYYMARPGKLTDPVDLSPWTGGKFQYLYETLDRAASQGIFLPVMDTHCTSCGLRDFCIWNGGSEPNRKDFDLAG